MKTKIEETLSNVPTSQWDYQVMFVLADERSRENVPSYLKYSIKEESSKEKGEQTSNDGGNVYTSWSLVMLHWPEGNYQFITEQKKALLLASLLFPVEKMSDWHKQSGGEHFHQKKHHLNRSQPLTTSQSANSPTNRPFVSAWKRREPIPPGSETPSPSCASGIYPVVAEHSYQNRAAWANLLASLSLRTGWTFSLWAVICVLLDPRILFL